jgi:hypothetical protein
MIKRILISIAFVMGGLFTWVLVTIMAGYAKALAGMSDGTAGGGESESRLYVSYLFYSYFAFSAISVLLCRRRAALANLGIVAHGILVVFVLLWLSKSPPDNAKSLLSGLIRAVLVGTVYLTPWIFLWRMALRNVNDPK